MIVTLTDEADAARVTGELCRRGLWATALQAHGDAPRTLSIAPHSARISPEELLRVPGVRSVAAPRSPHPRVDAAAGEVVVGRARFGPGRPPVLLAGPCAVESEEQIERLARKVAERGASFLRGGAFKPRSSPYAFQGAGASALSWLRGAARRHGLQVVTEVLSERDVDEVAEASELVQIGSRNMQNFALLKALGATRRPVLLKRAMHATVEEWLLAAEYLHAHGAPGVILCERGVRSFDPSTRNLLDLGAVALLAHVHRLPVVVDPSHAAGRRDLVGPLGRAALAAGAAGLLVEVHDDPAAARSDGPQALAPAELAALAAWGTP